MKSWFIKRQFIGVPCVDTLLRQVDDSDSDVGTFGGDDAARWTTHISCADACYAAHHHADKMRLVVVVVAVVVVAVISGVSGVSGVCLCMGWH